MLPLSNAEIGEVVSRLLNVPDSGQARRLLKEHPWLTSEDVSAKLTQIIANKHRRGELPDVAVFTACRGFLDRCRVNGVGAALSGQSGWPLSTQGPMSQLLALDETAPADQVIARAGTVLGDIQPAAEPDLYGWAHFNIGVGYQAKADAGSRTASAQAVRHFELAVRAWTKQSLVFGRKFREFAEHNLGRLYIERRDGNRGQNIETALHWLAQARKACPEGSIDLMDVSILTGKAYIGRIQGERLENIERAISHYKTAYDIAGKEQLTTRLGEVEHSLAVAYRVRLLDRGAGNYEEAKKWAERALTRFDREVDPLGWARTRAELATIYAHRRQGMRDDNLEKAISYAKEALEVYDPDAQLRQWTLVHLHLGNLYCDRMTGARSANLDKATEHFQAVLGRHSQETDPVFWAEATNNLGTVYASHSTSPCDAGHLEARERFASALRVCDPEILPDQARMIGHNWGNLAFRLGQWEEAWSAFRSAMQAGENLYQVSSTEAGRRVELAESAGMAAKVAYCLLKLGQRDQALLELENSRTRMLAEALSWEKADLARLPPAQQKAIRSLRAQVREIEADMRPASGMLSQPEFLERANRLRETRAELRELIAAIQKEWPDFMPLGLDLPGILALIPREGALVIPLITTRGCAVFVLPHGAQEIKSRHILWLDGFTQGAFLKLLVGSPSGSGLGGWMGAYLAHRTGPTRSSLEEWQNVLDQCSTQLWTGLMRRVHRRLVQLGVPAGAPVTLVPQGGLGLLPLHAAGRQGRGVRCAFLDRYTVTYAPSTYALSISRRRLQDERRRRASLLAVVNPTSDLPFAPVEGKAVAALYPATARRTLVGREATTEETVKATPGHAYLHFSCHGSYDWDNVMRSGLWLSNGDGGALLTLADILSTLDLGAVRLVTLSACETGLTEFQQSPDEYVGLPAGFLQAGAPAVIGTLWSVSDLSTALLMERFYTNHRCGDPDQAQETREPLPPGEALRRAQVWLRDKVTVEVVATRCKLEVGKLRERNELVPQRLSWAQREYASRARKTPGLRPFAHPYYWAAFTLSGAELDGIAAPDEGKRRS